MGNKYHVEFDVEQADPIPASGNVGWNDWNAAGRHAAPRLSFESTGGLLIVPKDATITKIEPPMEDGYYLFADDFAVYKRELGVWSVREDSWASEQWLPLLTTDDTARSGEPFFLKPLGDEPEWLK